jgi:hypothetical protein
MIEWTTLRAHMRANYDLLGDEPDVMSLAWTFVDETGTELIEHQWVTRGAAGGVPHVAIVCPVGPQTRLSLIEALRHNNTLAIGALALVDDAYVLREVLPLDALTFAALRRALELVAHEAARLREASASRAA